MKTILGILLVALTLALVTLPAPADVVTTGQFITNNNMAELAKQSSDLGLTLRVKSTTVELAATGTTTLHTVPAGLTFIPIGVVVTPLAITGTATGVTFVVSGSSNTLFTSGTYTSATQNVGTTNQTFGATTTTFSGGDTLKIVVLSGSTSPLVSGSISTPASYTATVSVIGYSR